MAERLQVVDENDDPIRVATREEAWANGWILRSAFIVLRDVDGNFLLQQRSLKKKTAPGKWTFAASGHVDEGESYDDAAPRELLEEIGIKTDLSVIGKMRITLTAPGHTDDHFVTVYTGTIDRDTPITVDKEEVETTRWLSPDELNNEVSDAPENFSPKLLAIYKQFFS